jgi:hypothetical protein
LRTKGNKGRGKVVNEKMKEAWEELKQWLIEGVEYMEECGVLERKVAYKSVLDEMEILGYLTLKVG